MKLNVLDVGRPFEKVYPEIAANFPSLTSTQLWALSLYLLPTSPYANMFFQDKKTVIQSIFSETIDWDKILQYQDVFLNLTLPKAYRLLVTWEQQLEERFRFIQDIKYEDKNIDQIKLKEEMLRNTHKLWEEYEKCRKLASAELDSSTEGGSIESLSESGII